MTGTSNKKSCARCGALVTDDGHCQSCFGELSPFTSKSEHQTETHEDVFARSNLIVPGGFAVLVNKDTNERYQLAQSVNKIGRDKANSISLHDDSYVSRHHAWVLFMKGSYWVEDLGSTNGTLLNGEVLSERKQIFPGDHIKLGRTELVFELS